jgi:hypothetical protein
VTRSIVIASVLSVWSSIKEMALQYSLSRSCTTIVLGRAGQEPAYPEYGKEICICMSNKLKRESFWVSEGACRLQRDIPTQTATLSLKEKEKKRFQNKIYLF